MSELRPLTNSDRVLIISPHPDDESLATGGLIQVARTAGAQVRVLYASNGDNNPWPQRVKERKFKINDADRARWGEIRRQEAMDALSHLGLPAYTAAEFLGMPDQGFTRALLKLDGRPTNALKRIIECFRPTLLVSPSLRDRHPDHNALAVIVNLVLQQVEFPIEHLDYVVHSRENTREADTISLTLTPLQQQLKREAIQKHKTQMLLSRGRFLRYANSIETFYKPAAQGAVKEASLPVTARITDRTLHVQIPQPSLPFVTPKLLIVLESLIGGSFRWILPLPKKPGPVTLQDATRDNENGISGTVVAHATMRERIVKISIATLEPLNQLFVKLQTPTVFYDRHGWCEVPLTPSGETSPAAEQAAEPVRTPGRFAMARGTLIWSLFSLLVLCWLGFALSEDIRRPWVNFVDYNGAVWSQAAHNILRAGLLNTEGASTGFYFGALPIPAKGYYLHHPPLLHLLLTWMFALFGEHEWTARLLPISCSIMSAAFLWLMVRSCAGVRAAAFSVAVFAFLPMELHYGKMVNFEPLVMMLVLGGLLSLRYWENSGKMVWKVMAMSSFMLGMWVDWAMYIFVAVLCICWFFKRDTATKRMAWALTAAMVLFGAIYLLRIRFIRPDAWDNLTQTFFRRINSHGSVVHFTEAQWLHRIGETLVTHFLPWGWVLALAGGLMIFKKRRASEGLRWLGWAGAVVAAMDLIFVGGFQNDSYIHPYIAFYLMVPVAIAAGVALDEITKWIGTLSTSANFGRYAGPAAACALLVLTGNSGVAESNALRRQFLVLDFKTSEPVDLIPKLGQAIQQSFDPHTYVLCNFLPVYGPQLGYYAQRNLLNNVQDYRYWRSFLQSPLKNNIGGVVWLNSDKAREILSKLPSGSKRFLHLGNASFCIWKPSPSLVLKGSYSKSS